jgi:hypothetical protein
VKVQLFAPVHKALRYASLRVLTDLGTCPGDLAAVARALASTRELFALQEMHQRMEDTYVIPAIEARRPGAAARLVEAHADHGAAIPALRARIEALEIDTTAAGLRALYLELSRFVADNLLHMYEEEALAEPLLEEIYTQAELATLVGRITAALTQAEHDAFAAVMLPALSHTERAAMGGGR